MFARLSNCRLSSLKTYSVYFYAEDVASTQPDGALERAVLPPPRSETEFVSQSSLEIRGTPLPDLPVEVTFEISNGGTGSLFAYQGDYPFSQLCPHIESAPLNKGKNSLALHGCSLPSEREIELVMRVAGPEKTDGELQSVELYVEQERNVLYEPFLASHSNTKNSTIGLHFLQNATDFPAPYAWGLLTSENVTRNDMIETLQSLTSVYSSDEKTQWCHHYNPLTGEPTNAEHDISRHEYCILRSDPCVVRKKITRHFEQEILFPQACRWTSSTSTSDDSWVAHLYLESSQQGFPFPDGTLIRIGGNDAVIDPSSPLQRVFQKPLITNVDEYTGWIDFRINTTSRGLIHAGAFPKNPPPLDENTGALPPACVRTNIEVTGEMTSLRVEGCSLSYLTEYVLQIHLGDGYLFNSTNSTFTLPYVNGTEDTFDLITLDFVTRPSRILDDIPRPVFHSKDGNVRITEVDVNNGPAPGPSTIVALITPTRFDIPPANGERRMLAERVLSLQIPDQSSQNADSNSNNSSLQAVLPDGVSLTVDGVGDIDVMCAARSSGLHPGASPEMLLQNCGLQSEIEYQITYYVQMDPPLPGNDGNGNITNLSNSTSLTTADGSFQTDKFRIQAPNAFGVQPQVMSTPTDVEGISVKISTLNHEGIITPYQGCTGSSIA